MSEEPKRWKRGDVGPDGRVFWKYDRKSRGGEYWISRERARVMQEKRRSQPQGWVAEQSRRKNLRVRFRQIGKVASIQEFHAFVESFNSSHQILGAIFRLTPDPGQTLAELIHDLSGYTMEVCELIANPEKLDNPPSASTLTGGTDLF